MWERNEKSSSKVFWKTFLFSFLPTLPLVVYLIYTLVGENLNMFEAIIVACSSILVGILSLISVIIGVSIKRPKKSDTDAIKKDTNDVSRKIGNNENSTIFGETEKINDSLKTIKDFNSEKINAFITKQEARMTATGDSSKALDIIQNSINSLNFQVEKLTNRNLELEKKIEIMQHHLNEKDDLIKKLSNNFDKNPGFER